MTVSTAMNWSACEIPGNGFSRTVRIQLKTVAFPPIPMASVNTATAVNPGALASIRNP
jgi:hypothetical protein